VTQTNAENPAHVDWEFAKATGRRLVPPGPSVSPDQVAAAVASIRDSASRSRQPVADTARMHAPGDAPAPLVVDRPTWISANADSMSALLDPIFATLLRRTQMASGGATSGAAAAMSAWGGKVTGAEAGALLAFLASKVLGQYDLAPQGTPRLMLVAPNVVQVERELAVDPDDFRLWVCMHEETHRVQFTAVPWLRGHMIDGAQSLASEMLPDPDTLMERAQQLVARLPEAIRTGGNGIVELVATPEQRARLAQLTAVMALLEGHADVVMDEVGPAVIPSVAEIRAKFTARRQGVGAFDRLLRRLLGLEAKMRQYRDGAAFVRGAVERVGVDGFNHVWSAPETLPTPAEIADPGAWVRRVHG
jgi:coenzyme F420 biosynthesis associated uncharacterized protein